MLPEAAEQLAPTVGKDGERFQAAHALALAGYRKASGEQ